MRFRVERDALHDAAGIVGRIAAKAPPYNGALLTVEGDKLRLSATDLDVSASTALAVADGLSGKVVVPAKRLVDAINALRPGAVEVEADEGGPALSLRSGVSSATLPVCRADEFPRLPEAVNGMGLIDGAAFRTALARVVPAVGNDDKRPVLTGVYFETEDGRLRLTATDSYRLMSMTTDLEWTGGPMLVPGLALRELARLGKSEAVQLGSHANFVSFGVGETVLTARLIEGDYPRYRRLIPASTPYHLEVDAEEMAEALRRIAPTLDAPSSPVRLDITASSVQLTCVVEDGRISTDELAASWDGPDLLIGFRPSYLSDAIEAAGTERPTVGIVDGPKPAVVISGGWVGLVNPHYGVLR